MFKPTIIVLFIYSVISANTIDSTMTTCQSQNQTTEGQMQCISDATQKWDTELNSVYKKLIAVLPAADKEVLKNSQRTWVQFKEKEIAFIDQSFAWDPKTKGTIVKLYRMSFILDITKERAITLKKYLDGYEDSSEK